MIGKPSEALVRAARRAGAQPFFLAHVFAVYQDSNNLDESALAHLLGCAENNLPRLALCHRPAAESEAFRAEVNHLASRFQLDSVQLASIIRQVDALQALRYHLATDAQGSGMLRAARDRDELEQSKQENDDD